MSTLVRPRKPLLALMMSLVLPGFGQLYNGEPNRAIWLFLAYCGLTAVGAAFAALYVPSGLMMAALLVGLCLTVGIWIYSMVDAWKTAKRQPDFVPRAWQTSGLYVLVVIVCVFIVQPLFGSYVRDHEVESFRDPSSSMEPTLMRGDYIFADKRYNCPNCKQAVQRGDIAIFTYPNDRTVYYVKRIVGLPGERVQIRGHDVLIDGRSLLISASQTSDWQQVVEGDGPRQWRVIWAKSEGSATDIDTRVPAGHVFVLGDNRNVSVDSRSIGTVPLQDVVGRVRQVWGSYADGHVRWARMGRVIE
jgi:signal peptidase I